MKRAWNLCKTHSKNLINSIDAILGQSTRENQKEENISSDSCRQDPKDQRLSFQDQFEASSREAHERNSKRRADKTDGTDESMNKHRGNEILGDDAL